MLLGKDDAAVLPSPIAVYIDAYDEGSIWIDLDDGRTVGVPLSWFPWLLRATQIERERVSFVATTLCWDDLDQTLCIHRLLSGTQL